MQESSRAPRNRPLLIGRLVCAHAVGLAHFMNSPHASTTGQSVCCVIAWSSRRRWARCTVDAGLPRAASSAGSMSHLLSETQHPGSLGCSCLAADIRRFQEFGRCRAAANTEQVSSTEIRAQDPAVAPIGALGASHTAQSAASKQFRSRVSGLRHGLAWAAQDQPSATQVSVAKNERRAASEYEAASGH